MPEPRTLYYILSSGEATPVLTLGSALPKTRNGLDCFYYWRQAIRDGQWTHPAKGFTVNVDPAQREQWAQNFNRMRQLGDEVPIVKDHRDGDATATLGYVKDVRQNGPWYEELHQYLGDDAKTVALRNKLSVGIDPDYTDVKKQKYGSAIVHSAITSRPVIPGQGDAVPLAASQNAGAMPERFYLTLTNPAPSDTASPAVVAPLAAVVPQAAPAGGRSSVMPNLMCSEEHLSALRKIVPNGDALTNDNIVEAMVQHLQKLSFNDEADAGGPEAVAKMSRADIIDTALKNRKAVKASEQRLSADNANLRNEVAELSKRVPKQLDPEAESALKDAVHTEAAQLVRESAIIPAVRDHLLGVLVGKEGKTNVLALSRAANPAGDKALALAVLGALRGNRPVPLGEQSGLQVLSRTVPDDTATADEKKKEAAASMFNKHLTAGMAVAK